MQIWFILLKMLHFPWHRYAFLSHTQGWSRCRAVSFAPARTSNILVFSSPSSQMPAIGFPFLFLAVFISLQLNLSLWQPAKPYLWDATWLYLSGNKRVCCLHSCSWRKPSWGEIWEPYPWHIDLGALNRHGISGPFSSELRIPFLFFYHLLLCKFKNLWTEEKYLLEREPTRRKKGQVLDKGFHDLEKHICIFSPWKRC